MLEKGASAFFHFYNDHKIFSKNSAFGITFDENSTRLPACLTNDCDGVFKEPTPARGSGLVVVDEEDCQKITDDKTVEYIIIAAGLCNDLTSLTIDGFENLQLFEARNGSLASVESFTMSS